MSCLEEGRAREVWGWHALLSSTSTTIWEKKISYFLHIAMSPSITADQRVNTGFTLPMGRGKLYCDWWGGFEELLSIWPTWAKDGLFCVRGWFRSLCYLHWFMRLLHSRSIADYRSTSAGGLMWEDQPGLGFCSKSSSWKEERIKWNPKTCRLTPVVREMGSCWSQR